MPASYPLSHPDAASLQTWFSKQTWAERIERPYALFAFRVRGESLAWAYYPKKKVLVEEGKPGSAGSGAAALLTATFPQLAPAVKAGAKAAHAYPYAGSDESGKGDTFGPLVVAACRLDQREEELLVTMGVKDSKLIGDAQINALSEIIRQTVPQGIALRALTPAIYNQAMADVRSQGGNLNTLLGRMHGACLSELHAKKPLAWVMVDQFGDPKYLRHEIPKGLAYGMEPRAEAFPAVAAASILAREACLKWFAKEAAQGRAWPKGSSDPRIVPLLRSVRDEQGSAGIWEVAKVHFQSVQDVLDG
jgi:ribonuclease HIII